MRGSLNRLFVPLRGREQLGFNVLLSVLAVAISTGVIALLDLFAESSSLGIVYLLAVVVTAVMAGRVYAIGVSLASVVLFDYLFIRAGRTFSFGHGQWITLAVFLGVAVVITDLAASRERIISAQDVERRRLERNLHDGAQQHIVTLALRADGVGAALPPELGDQKAELSSIARGLGSVLEELRQITAGSIQRSCPRRDSDPPCARWRGAPRCPSSSMSTSTGALASAPKSRPTTPSRKHSPTPRSMRSRQRCEYRCTSRSGCSGSSSLMTGGAVPIRGAPASWGCRTVSPPSTGR